MATYVLEILDGDRAGETLPVGDRTLRIGRKPGNDLVLADEKTSGVHAEVVLEGDRHVLRDLGSTNGTFLDGKRVTEIVLTPGDVVTVGRLRVRFREEGAAAAADAGDLAVHKLDASRLQRRGGSITLLAGLVVAGLGVGGYLWWQGRGAGEGGEAGRAHAPKAPLAIPGNRLAAAIANCDSEEGWNPRAAGAPFQPTTSAHTGTGAFEASRPEGADAADFAVLRLAEPVSVLAGRTFTLAAHLRCRGEAKVALRAVCFPNGDAGPLRYRTGSAFAVPAAWERVEAVVSVPTGCDRMQFEVVALLPGADAAVAVDDVAILEAGASTAIEHKATESSQTLVGTGSALAIRSTDPENPATLVALSTDSVPPAMAGLQRAGLCVLSDLGVRPEVTATERSFVVDTKGVDALIFVFPAESAGGLLVEGAEPGFGSAPAESEFTGKRLVLGDRATRAMLQFDAPVVCKGQLGGGLYRLRVQSARTEIVLGFRSERLEASELLRQAKTRLQEGRPGQALDLLRELVRKVPMDSEFLAQAQTMRAEVLATQGERLRQLDQALDEAAFFDTRGAFERVAQGVTDVIALYGENNLEDAASANALRERAMKRLAEMDSANVDAQRKRLDALAKAFQGSGQAGLAQLVNSYAERHLGSGLQGSETAPGGSRK
ncbi:MAG: FHA domain-containing protein [Planctomycetes bacterium]|nr:FHA domain-containing protein [Planctomycetota bacterium]